MKRLVITLVIVMLVLSGCNDGKVDGNNIEIGQKEEVKAVDDSIWDDLKDVDKIIGKSDKDFLELTKSKPNDVRNDSTGKWKKSTFSKNVNIEEYLLSYADLYMVDGDVHFVINFNYNTTTRQV